MASRDTLEQAEELKQKLEATYPGLVFEIEELRQERFTQRHVLEARNCDRCGAQILTAAIGEYSVAGDFCKTCAPLVKAERAALAERISAEAKAKHDRLIAFDIACG